MCWNRFWRRGECGIGLIVDFIFVFCLNGFYIFF